MVNKSYVLMGVMLIIGILVGIGLGYILVSPTVSSLNDKIKSLEDENTNLRNSLDSLNGVVEGLRDENSRLRARVESMNSTIAMLEQQLNTTPAHPETINKTIVQIINKTINNTQVIVNTLKTALIQNIVVEITLTDTGKGYASLDLWIGVPVNEKGYPTVLPYAMIFKLVRRNKYGYVLNNYTDVSIPYIGYHLEGIRFNGSYAFIKMVYGGHYHLLDDVYDGDVVNITIYNVYFIVGGGYLDITGINYEMVNTTTTYVLENR